MLLIKVTYLLTDFCGLSILLLHVLCIKYASEYTIPNERTQ